VGHSDTCGWAKVRGLPGVALEENEALVSVRSGRSCRDQQEQRKRGRAAIGELRAVASKEVNARLEETTEFYRER
jgi:hypothetical protein